MFDSSGNILISPIWQVFFGIFLFSLVVFFASLRTADRGHFRSNTKDWIRKYYIWVLIAVTAAYFIWAGATYLWQVPGLVNKTLVMLNEAFDNKDADNIRHLTYAFAAMIGALAILPTVPFQLIKAWINERSATNAEQGHITDRINKAVEGLGATKTVKFQRTDAKGNLTFKKDNNGKTDYAEPVMVEESQPNLEVRIGAIFALERISQDSLRDHVQIMEILTAYIRENAKIGEIPKYEKTDEWRNSWPTPRTDIQAAMSVIGRRKDAQLEKEIHDKRHLDTGYQLDLRETDLRGIDINGLNFKGVNLAKAHLEGANLFKAHLEGAYLTWAHLEGANLTWAHLEGAILSRTHLEGAILTVAQLKEANLTWAHLEGAILTGAHLEGAILTGAHLEGANLTAAHLEGANLSRTHLDENTYFNRANFQTVMLKEVDFTTVNISHKQVKSSFGDGSVTLPEGMEWPEHWPEHELDRLEFFREYEIWRDNSEGYKPPKK